MQDESTVLQEFACFGVVKALRQSENIVQGFKSMNILI